MLKELLEIDYPDFVPISRDLCAQCKAECCDSTTPFTMDDVKVIKRKYRKLLRGVKLIHSIGDAYMLTKQNNEQCVFLDENKRCKIYDSRPQICRDFGDKPYCLCAYNGLSAIPADKKEIDFLASQAQKKNGERLAAAMGVKMNVNMVDSEIANVLSPKYLKDILDFR